MDSDDHRAAHPVLYARLDRHFTERNVKAFLGAALHSAARARDLPLSGGSAEYFAELAAAELFRRAYARADRDRALSAALGLIPEFLDRIERGVDAFMRGEIETDARVQPGNEFKLPAIRAIRSTHAFCGIVPWC